MQVSKCRNAAAAPFGFVRDGEEGHRIGVRLVGAAQLDVARHGDGDDEEEEDDVDEEEGDLPEGGSGGEGPNESCNYGDGWTKGNYWCSGNWVLATEIS